MLVISSKFYCQNVKEMTTEAALKDLPQFIPAGCIKETIESRIQKIMKQQHVMLFMKGCPEAPECGFSKKLVALLAKYVGSVIPGYGHFDILKDPEVRENLKKISKWPTYPQLYAGGKLIGGIDVCTELDEEGEFEDELVEN